jgi:hypothetical protein
MKRSNKSFEKEELPHVVVQAEVLAVSSAEEEKLMALMAPPSDEPSKILYWGAVLANLACLGRGLGSLVLLVKIFMLNEMIWIVSNGYLPQQTEEAEQRLPLYLRTSYMHLARVVVYCMSLWGLLSSRKRAVIALTLALSFSSYDCIRFFLRGRFHLCGAQLITIYYYYKYLRQILQSNYYLAVSRT